MHQGRSFTTTIYSRDLEIWHCYDMLKIKQKSIYGDFLFKLLARRIWILFKTSFQPLCRNDNPKNKLLNHNETEQCFQDVKGLQILAYWPLFQGELQMVSPQSNKKSKLKPHFIAKAVYKLTYTMMKTPNFAKKEAKLVH